MIEFYFLCANDNSKKLTIFAKFLMRSMII